MRKKDKRLWCAYCGQPVAYHDRHYFDLKDTATGQRAIINWHMSCVDEDLYAQAMFDIDSEREQKADADDRFSQAFAAFQRATKTRPGRAYQGIVSRNMGVTPVRKWGRS